MAMAMAVVMSSFPQDWVIYPILGVEVKHADRRQAVPMGFSFTGRQGCCIEFVAAQPTRNCICRWSVANETKAEDQLPGKPEGADVGAPAER
jgi:hypothetical protein